MGSTTNDDNATYYEAIGAARLEASATAGGFNGWKDLSVASEHISPGDSILEIGAGYGRVLDYLLHTKHRGAITAIEKSGALFDFLSDKYGSLGNLRIQRGDIRTMQLPGRVDVALWMWSGFADFSREEQHEACATVHRLLGERGRLVIDVPRPGTQTIARHIDAKHLRHQTAFGTLSAYIPDDEDLEAIRERCGYERLIRSDYETATGRARTIYVLVKK